MLEEYKGLLSALLDFVYLVIAFHLEFGLFFSYSAFGVEE